MSEVVLLSEQAWADGIWLRSRSGPRPRGNAPVQVSVWHRVRDLGGAFQRLRTACGYGPRNGFSWPNGGSRLEIAHPLFSGRELPGAVCQRCLDARQPDTAEEQVLPDVPDLEELTTLVMGRLEERSKATVNLESDE